MSRLGPRNILDFGCGDGVLFQSFGYAYDELCLYDSSSRMVELARHNFSNCRNKLTFLTQPHDIPSAYFDAVVCSLVLMTVPTEDQLRKIAKLIHDSAKSGAYCFVAVTHPCFLQYPFSTFRTEFADGASFPYLTQGTPFNVRLSDATQQNFVHFTDYHWPLSTLVNLFVGANFDLLGMVELPDRSQTNTEVNRNFPAYLVMELSVR